jgi:rhombotail lipoprotein
VIVPDYYLTGARGFDGLQGVQRLYNIDLMALVSYDQVTHLDDNRWSLTYLTIIGAYVIPGSSHDVATLLDLAVVDPARHARWYCAPAAPMRACQSSTLIDRDRDARTASAASFGVASQHMIDNFDAALVRVRGSGEGGARECSSRQSQCRERRQVRWRFAGRMGGVDIACVRRVAPRVGTGMTGIT